MCLNQEVFRNKKYTKLQKAEIMSKEERGWINSDELNMEF